MRIKNIFIVLTLAAASMAASAKPSPADYVNPVIGSAHSRWFFFTPAAVPFGMAKPSASTDGHLGSKRGWQANGYDPRHESIEGFVNFHEFQIGGVAVMPTVGTLQTVPGSLDDPDSGYRSRFDKEDEYARPGYYSVFLKDYGIKAELTASKRVAWHRYVFPESDESHLVFDIGHMQGESGPVVDAYVAFDGKCTIEGWVSTYPHYVQKYQEGGRVKMYFSAVLDKAPESWGTFIDGKPEKGAFEAEGPGCGLYLDYETDAGEAVEIRFGLSYTSVANARLNLESEAAGMNFNAARKRALRIWDDYLGRIQVSGGREEDKVKFHTGLYHALLGRGLASDVNGAYPAHDGSIGQIPLDDKGKPIHNHYNTDAIWGGCWNLTQLWPLICPDYYADWISSQLLVYKDSGWLGDGIANSLYVSGVGTNFTGMAIAAAYNCGIRNFDVRTAWEAAYKNEVEWRGRPKGAGKIDLEHFVKDGYCRFAPGVLERDSSKMASSHVLEYSFTSSAVARFAELLGYGDEAVRLRKQADNWKNIYDPALKMFHSRGTDGCFHEPFDTLSSQQGFQEGNAVQYGFYVPHDPETLVSMMGQDTFNERLDRIFTESRKNIFGGGKTVNAFAGLGAVYNHGNQPCLYIPWLFNFSGRPDLSQKWVRLICDEFYGTEPVHGYGYGQDEDQGQLGAWYVMSSIGLFDVKGLSSRNPSFQIGCPLFDKTVISLSGGRKFVISTTGNARENGLVHTAILNGKALGSLNVPFSEVISGGHLILDNIAK